MVEVLKVGANAQTDYRALTTKQRDKRKMQGRLATACAVRKRTRNTQLHTSVHLLDHRSANVQSEAMKRTQRALPTFSWNQE